MPQIRLGQRKQAGILLPVSGLHHAHQHRGHAGNGAGELNRLQRAGQARDTVVLAKRGRADQFALQQRTVGDDGQTQVARPNGQLIALLFLKCFPFDSELPDYRPHRSQLEIATTPIQ